MTLKKLFIFSFAVVGLFVNLPLSYADEIPAPVEELSTPQEVDDANAPNDMSTQSSEASDVRLARVEQQVRNMTDMNMPQQISELRQEVQQLNGQLQVQEHEIKTLENQQRAFYQDLNSRIPGGAKQALSNQNTTQATTANTASNDATAYRAAFDLLVKKKYDDALSAFQDYVGAYPKGEFLDSAYYWMGELYLKRNDTEMAEKSFTRLISQFPNSNKVSDAKLKLAMIHMKQGKKAQAQQEFSAIKKQYPNSTAAQLANLQLQRMEQ